MSRFINEEGISLGYSSETDDYESECGRGTPLTAEQHEIYVGNTGKVPLDKYYQMFRQYGAIKDFTVWRTHNHLYHARIVYRGKAEAKKVVVKMNNRRVFGKRIRVSPVLERTVLKYGAAIRIDDIAPGVSEEDIYEHFEQCGEIKFVVKVGYAAYVQFQKPISACEALKLDMILNGDPYMLCRLWANDRIDHVQVIDNMKDIKYRKPFVMVENYPELPFEELSRYKENFESIGPVRHFKIAATGNKTVTLALCMDKADDRDLVIDRFNDAVISGKRLKLYMAPGKARMTPNHVAKYAICKNSIRVDNIPAYFKDYEVCMLFAKCGATISFVEKVANCWIICFDSPWMVSFVQEHHFMTFQYELKIVNLTQETLPINNIIRLRDPEGHRLSTEILKALKDLGDFLAKKEPVEVPEERTKKLEDLGEKMEPIKVPEERTSENILKRALQNVDTTPTKPVVDDPQKYSSPIAKVTPMHKQTISNSGSVRSNDDNLHLFKLRNHELMSKSVIISNLPKGISEKDIRASIKNVQIKAVSLYCSHDPYYPTSSAAVNVVSKPCLKILLNYHQKHVLGKRLFVRPTITPWSSQYFAAEQSIMLKNLQPDITEEAILEEVEKILGPGTVEDVHKPTHYYGYFDLKGELTAHQVLHRLRSSFMSAKIDVFPLYCNVPKRYLRQYLHIRRTLSETRDKYGAVPYNETDKEKFGDKFGEHNAHRLFVGNIPRVVQTEDVIAYFNNFGTVIDYSQIKKNSCVLRKSAIISFVNANHARNAYCQQPHFLEGSQLGVHIMDASPMSKPTKGCQLITVKVRTKYLTDDEIRQELQKVVNVAYDIRFDAFNDRANYLMYCRDVKQHGKLSQNCLTIHHINDEPIKIIVGQEEESATDDDSLDELNITSPYRKQKESFLGYAVYTETLEKEMELRTRPLGEEHVPYRDFYNEQSVQINNVSQNTNLQQFQHIFIKCGDIEYYSELYLQEDASKICFIKFKLDLSADLACKYNQRMVNGKRILVHRAKETLVSEWDRSVLLERLNPMTNAENIHDAFSTVGTVKYVQKQSPFKAIVCFKDVESVSGAMRVTSVPYSNHIMTNPCREEYNYRLYANFTCQEQRFSIERILRALKRRILPEFHQLEIERRNEYFEDANTETNKLEKTNEDEEHPTQSKRARTDESGHVQNELETQQRIEPIVTTVSPSCETQPHEWHHQQQSNWEVQQQIASMAYNAGPSYHQDRGYSLGRQRQSLMSIRLPPHYH